MSGRGERIIHNPVDLEATKELRSFQTFEGDINIIMLQYAILAIQVTNCHPKHIYFSIFFASACRLQKS